MRTRRRQRGLTLIDPAYEGERDYASVLATLWQAGVNYIQGHYLQGPSQSMNYDFSADDE